MKVFITGDQGFIGTNLTRYLKDKNYEVLNPKVRTFSSKYDRGNSVDVNKYAELILAIQNADAVIHLAARKGSWFCEADVKDTITTNTYGTYNVAKVCAEMGKPLLHFGTTAYYDTNQKLPEHFYDENTPLKPKTAYGVSKLAGEQLLPYINGLRYFVIRPVYAYGNYGDFAASRSESWPDVVLQEIEKQRKTPLITDLGGEFIKDYTHISDVCDATEKLFDLFMREAIHSREVIQVGCGGNYKFNAVMDAFKAPFEIDYSPSMDYKGHQPHSYTRLKYYLPHWYPTVDIIDYARNRGIQK